MRRAGGEAVRLRVRAGRRSGDGDGAMAWEVGGRRRGGVAEAGRGCDKTPLRRIAHVGEAHGTQCPRLRSWLTLMADSMSQTLPCDATVSQFGPHGDLAEV